VFSSPDTTHEQGFSPVNFFYNCPNFRLPISLVIKIWLKNPFCKSCDVDVDSVLVNCRFIITMKIIIIIIAVLKITTKYVTVKPVLIERTAIIIIMIFIVIINLQLTRTESTSTSQDLQMKTLKSRVSELESFQGLKNLFSLDKCLVYTGSNYIHLVYGTVKSVWFKHVFGYKCNNK
jgi:hypothetical protein